MGLNKTNEQHLMDTLEKVSKLSKESEVDMARDWRMDMENRIAQLEQAHGKVNSNYGTHYYHVPIADDKPDCASCDAHVEEGDVDVVTESPIYKGLLSLYKTAKDALEEIAALAYTGKSNAIAKSALTRMRLYAQAYARIIVDKEEAKDADVESDDPLSNPLSREYELSALRKLKGGE